MFLALFWVDAPKQPFIVEPFENANEEIAQRLYWLKVILMAVHCFCFVGLIFIALPFTSDLLITIGRVFGILSMIAQVLSVSLVCQQIFTKIDQSL